jgi:hypothetical protein
MGIDITNVDYSPNRSLCSGALHKLKDYVKRLAIDNGQSVDLLQSVLALHIPDYPTAQEICELVDTLRHYETRVDLEEAFIEDLD